MQNKINYNEFLLLLQCSNPKTSHQPRSTTYNYMNLSNGEMKKQINKWEKVTCTSPCTPA